MDDERFDLLLKKGDLELRVDSINNVLYLNGRPVSTRIRFEVWQLWIAMIAAICIMIDTIYNVLTFHFR